MNGIIFYQSNRDQANEILDNMVKKYKEFKGINPIQYCNLKRGAFATFENGDTWKVLLANDNARGYRWNVAYVERCIDWDTFCTVIRPKGLELPYSAINLWGEGNLHITEEVPLPF